MPESQRPQQPPQHLSSGVEGLSPISKVHIQHYSWEETGSCRTIPNNDSIVKDLIQQFKAAGYVELCLANLVSAMGAPCTITMTQHWTQLDGPGKVSVEQRHKYIEQRLTSEPWLTARLPVIRVIMGDFVGSHLLWTSLLLALLAYLEAAREVSSSLTPYEYDQLSFAAAQACR